MKLATLKDDSRDGQLIVVSRDLKTAQIADEVADTLQRALDDWNFHAPQLMQMYERLNVGRGRNVFEFDPAQCMAPLPRAYQRVNGSAYVSHLELVRKSQGAEMPDAFWGDPLLCQAGSDDFLGPMDDIELASEAWGIDFESGIAVVTGDVGAGTTVDRAGEHIRLFMLVNDVSLRHLMSSEMVKGCGFYQSKPSSSFSPVVVTPDELGDAWKQGKLHLPLRSSINGSLVGQPNAGIDMVFSFEQLIAHASKTRRLRTGSIVGSGTASNRDAGKGYSCIAEKRALELINGGEAVTSYLQFGDKLRIEMLDKNGKSIFGAIEQSVAEPSV